MDKEKEKEKNINIIKLYLKENINMEKEMEKEKNMMIKDNYAMKEIIIMGCGSDVKERKADYNSIEEIFCKELYIEINSSFG